MLTLQERNLEKRIHMDSSKKVIEADDGIQQICRGENALISLESLKSQLIAINIEEAKALMLSEQVKLENLTQILMCQFECLQEKYGEAQMEAKK